jgi:hypothetical protein
VLKNFKNLWEIKGKLLFFEAIALNILTKAYPKIPLIDNSKPVKHSL